MYVLEGNMELQIFKTKNKQKPGKYRFTTIDICLYQLPKGIALWF